MSLALPIGHQECWASGISYHFYQRYNGSILVDIPKKLQVETYDEKKEKGKKQ